MLKAGWLVLAHKRSHGYRFPIAVGSIADIKCGMIKSVTHRRARTDRNAVRLVASQTTRLGTSNVYVHFGPRTH
jgi:hypothetical protein